MASLAHDTDSPASSRKALIAKSAAEPPSQAPSSAEPSDAPASAMRSKAASSPDPVEKTAEEQAEPNAPAPVATPAPTTRTPIATPALLETDLPPAQAEEPDKPRDTPAKPLLASEALMEDLAPIEPSRHAARFWCAAVGSGFAALGALPLVGVRSGGVVAALSSFLLGGIVIGAALTRVSYRRRAVAMLVLGSLVALLGFGGTGPAAGIAHGEVALGFSRLLAATCLPAALLFRARYRAYAGARWLLAAAFVAALPFIVLIGLRLSDLSPDLGTAGAVVAAAVMAASLVGFMGAETTGAGTYVGLSVLVGLGTELGLSDLSEPGQFESWRNVMSVCLSAVAFSAATGLSALGLFQILAWRLSKDARRIDIRRPKPEPPPPRRSNPAEWSS